jgi:hypothetical protein
MAVSESESLTHWNYFLALEDDLDRISRFIEFTSANYKCFSIELARTLLLACSEIDVVAKQLCSRIAPNTKAQNICDYRAIITGVSKSFSVQELFIPRHGLHLKPWENWNCDENPDWWRAHNLVKHTRHRHYPEANLENALNAVGALLIAVIHLYPDEAGQGTLAPNPRLFRVGPPIVVDLTFWGEQIFIYHVPES